MTNSQVKTLMYFSLMVFLHLTFFGCEKTDTKQYANEKHEKKIDDFGDASVKTSESKKPWSDSVTVRINNKLPLFSFKIVGEFKGDYFYPSHIEITDMDVAKVIQKLNVKGHFDDVVYISDIKDLFSNLAEFDDMNFDGYLDLRLLYSRGATGNDWYSTYLYDPKAREFKFHEKLSLLSAVTLDPKSKLIKTYWRRGGCEQVREYFKMTKDNRLRLEKVEWTETGRNKDNTGPICYKITGIPIDKDITYLGYTFYYEDEDSKAFDHLLRTKVKLVKKELLERSLDGSK